MKQPVKFAIWANTDKSSFWELLPGILAWADANRLKVYLTTHILAEIKDNSCSLCGVIENADDFSTMDFVLTLGGDGTILSTARAVGNRKTPILGIHLGDLGFLAEVTVNDLYSRLDQVAKGYYSTQPRMVLRCEIHNGTKSRTFYSLNEIVIDKGKSHRMISAQLQAAGHFVASYKADGVIVATPTGSTAYSLAAGGPIVAPGLSALVVSPICPHSLTYRPLVLSDDMELEITFPGIIAKDMAVTVDGQTVEYLNNSPKIIIRKADHQILMIAFQDSNYFHTLRTKMGWGRRGDN
ncbi:MAG: NAD(+)/NADH kinase [Candidatus Marinimicrobia bacterium]|nr:NAD(+)/NADH kinase [Candidatus Neomarinimicrobiota bacterium]